MARLLERLVGLLTLLFHHVLRPSAWHALTGVVFGCALLCFGHTVYEVSRSWKVWEQGNCAVMRSRGGTEVTLDLSVTTQLFKR